MKKIYVLMTLASTSFFVACDPVEHVSPIRVKEEKTELEHKIEKNKEKLKNIDNILEDLNKQIEKIDLVS